MRCEESVLPWNTLSVVPRIADRIEPRHPVPFRVPGPHETGGSVKYGCVSPGPGVIFLCEIFLAGQLRHPAYAPVVIGELKRLGDRLGLDVGGDVSEGVVRIGAGVGIGRFDHGLKGILEIERVEMNPSVRHHGDGMVADHALGVGARQRPHGKSPALVGHVHQTEHHVVNQRSVDQGHQRVPAPESVPQGKSGIESPSIWNGDDLLVEIPVTAVHIVSSVRDHHRVVQGGIEVSPGLLASALDLDRAESLNPSLDSLGTDGIKILFTDLSSEISGGALGVNLRKSHRNNDFFCRFREGQQHPVPFKLLRRRERDRERGVEINLPIRSPAAHMATAFDDGVALNVHEYPVRMGVTDIVGGVNQDVALSFSLE